MNTSKLLGLLAITICTVLILIFAFESNTIYHRSNMVTFDGVAHFFKSGVLLRIAHANGVLEAFREALSSSNTILYFLETAAFSPVLPLHPSLAVILNGVWYLGLAASLYLLFFHLTGSAFLAFSLGLPLLGVGAHEIFPWLGITDLNHTFFGYTLGGSSICWIVMSERFRRPGPCAVAGVCLGLLGLGRYAMFGLIVPAVLPLAALGLFRDGPAERRRSLRGLGLCLGVAALVCGWWLIPDTIRIFRYVYEGYHNPAGLLNKGFAHAAYAGSLFLRDFLAYNKLAPVLPLVFGWRLGASFLEAQSPWDYLKRFNWPFFCLGIVPVVVLFCLKSGYYAFGVLSYVGLYLTVMFPLRRKAGEKDPLLESKAFRWALLVAGLVTCFAFLHEMRREHSASLNSKANALTALHAILDHAAANGRAEAAVDLTTLGWLNHYSLGQLVIFDTDAALTWESQRVQAPAPRPSQTPKVRLLGYIRLHRGEPDPALRESLKQELQAILRDADYVVAMGPLSLAESQDETNKEFSRKVLESGLFEPITPALEIAGNEDVVVLARRPPGR